MSVYSLIGMASYSASIGYGITTAAVGIILTCTRILDGITDRCWPLCMTASTPSSASCVCC